MENKVLNVLIVDDSPDDAELPVRELRAAGYRLKTERVYNLAGMESALQKGAWDLVLSDLSLLQYSAQMALELLKRKKLEIPLIVITRSVSDDDFAAVTAAGARDVIRKNYTGRLVPAIRRELEVTAMRRELEQARKKVKEMEAQHSAMVTGTQEAVCYCTEGMHIEANQAYLNMFGYDSLADLEVIPVLNLIAKKDQKSFKDALKKAARGKMDSSIELEAVKENGDTINVEAVFAPVKMKGEDTIQVTFTDISARKATEDRLQYLTQRDALTGLYNRHFFTKELTHALTAAKNDGKTSAIIYFDLFQLEEINNTLGYTVGDGMLLKITKILKEHLGSDAMLARFGDEELTILLPDNDQAGADTLAQELKQLLDSANITADHKKYDCGCAIGTAEISGAMKSVHDAVSQAVIMSKDQRPTPKVSAPAATAKPAGTAAPTIETPAAPEPEAVEPSVTASAEPEAPAPEPAPQPVENGDPLISAALQSNGFRLVYQPIVSMQGETDEMYEVLVRMVGENDELISPGQFMPKAEASGQITAIDCWVMQRVLESLSAMAQNGRSVSYFVNIAPASASNIELANVIQNGINSGIDARNLVIEMSQPGVAENIDAVSKFITQMKELGCQISLDNSGPVTDTLLKLPRQSVKFLKFDGNVVSQLAQSEDADTLTAVMDMAKQLAIRTVATHIEDASSLSEIWPFGFDFVQGHYFQQPDSDMSYEFAADDETTLSEDGLSTPTWSQ
jgi:diguanylate cyclase (GGDEF)-like protein/PAS domain S-box-containing protein